MDFLLDPNVAYLILLGGVLLAMMSLASPGTGLFEIGAFFCIMLAGYAIYNLSLNWWALLLLGLSIVPFVYAIQRPRREVFLAISILLLIVGSVFMFPRKVRLSFRMSFMLRGGANRRGVIRHAALSYGARRKECVKYALRGAAIPKRRNTRR